MTGGRPPELRRKNRALVLRALVKHGDISRTGLAEAVGLTGTAITRITRELLDVGLIEEGDKANQGRFLGRPRTCLALASTGLYVIGLAMQAADRLLVLANLQGEILSSRQIPFEVVLDFTGKVDAVSNLVDELAAEAGISKKQIIGIGAAIAGAVDPMAGYVKTSPPLGWQDVPLVALLEDATGLPVAVDNVNNAICAAECQFGTYQGTRNLMLFSITQGAGASFVIDGEIVRGRSFAAGQIGHMPVTGASDLCSCGARGCLNTVVSGMAILADFEGTTYERLAARNADENTRRMLKMLERSLTGDVRAIRALHDAGERLGAILNVFTLAFQPEHVLLAGQIGRNPYFVKGVEDSVSRDTRLAGLCTDRVGMSIMGVDEAAVFLALSRFLLSEKLDLQTLKNLSRWRRDARSKTTAAENGAPDRWVTP